MARTPGTSLRLGAFYLTVAAIMAIVYLVPKVAPGNAALYDAIETGDTAQVRRRLEQGADPNSRSRGVFSFRSSRYLSPPLLYAMERRQPDIALVLIGSGADPNARDSRGRPALFVAAGAEDAEVVRALIEKGVDVHAVSHADGETALRFGPNGPGGRYPGSGTRPKDLTPEIRAMLERAGAAAKHIGEMTSLRPSQRVSSRLH